MTSNSAESNRRRRKSAEHDTWVCPKSYKNPSTRKDKIQTAEKQRIDVKYVFTPVLRGVRELKWRLRLRQFLHGSVVSTHLFSPVYCDQLHEYFRPFLLARFFSGFPRKLRDSLHLAWREKKTSRNSRRVWMVHLEARVLFSWLELCYALSPGDTMRALSFIKRFHGSGRSESIILHGSQSVVVILWWHRTIAFSSLFHIRSTLNRTLLRIIR